MSLSSEDAVCPTSVDRQNAHAMKLSCGQQKARMVSHKKPILAIKPRQKDSATPLGHSSFDLIYLTYPRESNNRDATATRYLPSLQIHPTDCRQSSKVVGISETNLKCAAVYPQIV